MHAHTHTRTHAHTRHTAAGRTQYHRRSTDTIGTRANTHTHHTRARTTHARTHDIQREAVRKTICARTHVHMCVPSYTRIHADPTFSDGPCAHSFKIQQGTGTHIRIFRHKDTYTHTYTYKRPSIRTHTHGIQRCAIRRHRLLPRLHRAKNYLDRDPKMIVPVYTGHSLFNTTKRITLSFIIQILLHHNLPKLNI